MTYEELMASIEATASDRMREMKEKAAAEAEGIRKAATERAAGFREEAIAQAKKKVEAEREKMIGRVREEAKLELLKRKQGVSLQVLQEAGDRVLAARLSPAYPRILRRLTEEALGLVGGSDLVLHVDPRDKVLLEKILRDLQKNSEVIADLESAGGLTIASRDGRFLVTNTLESRLSRARELLKGEVFTILYGG